MDVLLFSYLVIACLISAFIKGVTGLGFSTTCLALLAFVMELKVAIPLVIVPSLVSNLITMYGAGHFRETVYRFYPMFIATVPGIFIGLWALIHFNASINRSILGGVLIAYVLFALAKPSYVMPVSLQRKLSLPTGFVTGVLNGFTGSQVMPVLPYLMAVQLDPNRFIQAINCSFTLSSIIMVILLNGIGLMSLEHMWLSLPALFFVFAGVHIGTWVRKKLSTELFRRVVLAFLVLLGGGLMLRALE